MKLHLKALLVILLIASGIYPPSPATAQSLHWALPIGGPGLEFGYNLCLDSTGHAYATGGFHDSVDFDPGPGNATLTSAGFNDIYVAKYDANGNFRWAFRMGGKDRDAGYNIISDAFGHIYLTGFFEDSVDFAPGPGEAWLYSSSNSAPFIAKFDTAGNYLWAIGFDGNNLGAGMYLHIDPAGDLLITGNFYGTADFDPSAGVHNLTSAGLHDIFLAKYSPAGNLIWAQNMGSTGRDLGKMIQTDPLGNIFLSGEFHYTVDFDPGPGIAPLTSAGAYDAYLASYTPNGAYRWAIRWGSTGNDYAYGLRRDPAGDLRLTGCFQGTVDFDPGPGSSPRTASGSYDAYLLHLDPGGMLRNIHTFGGPGYDAGYQLEFSRGGRLIIAGEFTDTTDLDPGPGQALFPSAGGGDIFVATFDTATNFLSAFTIGGPLNDLGLSPQIDPNGSLYLTGYFQDSAEFDPGPGTWPLSSAGGRDAFLAKYVICQAVDTFFRATICNGDTFHLGTQALTTPGYFTESFNSVGGCDSIVNLDLRVMPSYQAFDTARICQGEIYLFAGQPLSSPGIYTAVFSAIGGCDSTVTLDLTVDFVDTTVLQSGNTLISRDSLASYQWVDCNHGYALIPGAVSATFTPPASGNYAVIVTLRECSDTSACYPINVLGTEAEAALAQLRIGPNPAHDWLFIEWGNDAVGPAQFRLFDALGQVVLDCHGGEGERFEMDVSGLERGMYWLRVDVGEVVRVFRVVLQ